VASSGIAALILIGGHTSHSCLIFPIAVNEDSFCNIKRGSLEAELIQKTSLLIYDEVIMQHRHCQEAFDCTCRDICQCDKIFGGLTVVFGGDFQQILPVMVKGF
jgi:ATP-dependent DNA helicase PIF1